MISQAEFWHPHETPALSMPVIPRSGILTSLWSTALFKRKVRDLGSDTSLNQKRQLPFFYFGVGGLGEVEAEGPDRFFTFDRQIRDE